MALTLGVLVAEPLPAQTNPADETSLGAEFGWTIEYVAPPECPDRAAFEHALVTAAQARGVSPETFSVGATITKAEAADYILELSIRMRPGNASRTLQGPDCDELASAAAQLVALSITREGSTQSRPPADAEQAPVPTPLVGSADWPEVGSGVSSGVDPTLPAKPRAPAKDARSSKPGKQSTPQQGKAARETTSDARWSVGGGLHLLARALPVTAPAVLGAIARRTGVLGYRLGVELSTTALSPESAPQARRLTIRPGVDFLWGRAQRLSAGLRMGTELSWLTALGAGSSSQTAPGLAVYLGPAAGLRLSERVLLLGTGQAFAQVLQARLVTQEREVTRTLWQQPLIGARVGLELEWDF